MTGGAYVVPLGRVGLADLGLVGGKAARLGELVRGKFPVPAGFVVTTEAYRAAVGEGVAAREAVARAEVPGDVADAVRAAYRELGGGAVAVRSSATTEDLPEAAFAGQQDTFLNVVGEDDVLDAVRRCWASLWSERAVDYRESRGIDHGRARIAVVVQRMVAAEFAGVTLTSDPVSGDRHRVVVDAYPGLGETVVSGMVTPEHIVVDSRRSRVVVRSAGRGEVVVRPRGEGGTERVAGAPPRGAELPESVLWRLVRIGRDVERYFGGRPQDIEWAWTAEGGVYVVQARPMTALPAPPGRHERHKRHERPPGARARFERMMTSTLAEILPIRPYPIDISAWVAPLIGQFEEPSKEATGFSVPSPDRLFVEEDGVVVGLEMPMPSFTWRAVTLAPVNLVRTAMRRDPGRWRADPVIGAMRRRARELRERDFGGASWADLIAVLDEGPRIAARMLELRLRYLPRTFLALAGLYAVLSALRRRRLMGALLSGVDTLTTDANRELEAMAATIRADAGRGRLPELKGAELSYDRLREVAPGLADELDAFLERYGHRDTATPLLITPPPWRDRPDIVLGILKGLASEPPPPAGTHPAERAERELFAHPLLRWAPTPPRTAVRALLRQARWFQQVRDDTRFLAMLPVPAMRRAILEMGRRLVEAGVLDAPEDTFHLRLDELRRAGAGAAWPPPPELRAELRASVTRRKAKRAELAGSVLVPVRPSGRAGGDVVLRGTPGSAGIAEGPVRVIHDVGEFGSLRNGDVLVAAYTNPAWTPLFRRAAAVVVDTGSVASHAAIVAREYGIPAVMATVHATTRLTDGQRVRVDGDHGLVLRPHRPG